MSAIHLVFGHLQRWLLGIMPARAGNTCSYLDEFAFRFNRRRAKLISHRFARLIDRCRNRPKNLLADRWTKSTQPEARGRVAAQISRLSKPLRFVGTSASASPALSLFILCSPFRATRVSRARFGNAKLLRFDGNTAFADIDLDASGLLPLFVELITKDHRSHN